MPASAPSRSPPAKQGYAFIRRELANHTQLWTEQKAFNKKVEQDVAMAAQKMQEAIAALNGIGS